MEKVMAVEENEVSYVESAKSIGVLGANFNLGQSKLGVEEAAEFLRGQDLDRFLSHFFSDVRDYGDVSQIGTGQNCKSPDQIKFNMKRLYQASLKVLEETEKALFIGGDHSISMATVAAVKKKKPDALILWVDAHGDINTPEQSNTGHLHGMPLAFLLGLVDAPQFAGFSEFHGCLSPEDLIYIGVRDLDIAEQDNIRNLGIELHTNKDIRTYGIKNCLEASMSKLDPFSQRPIHMSFDIDVLDPKWAACTGVPVEDGLSLMEINDMSFFFQQTGRIESLDFVEFNPALANSKMELEQSARILFHLMGGLFPYRERFEVTPYPFVN